MILSAFEGTIHPPVSLRELPALGEALLLMGVPARVYNRSGHRPSPESGTLLLPSLFSPSPQLPRLKPIPLVLKTSQKSSVPCRSPLTLHLGLSCSSPASSPS